MNIDPYQLICLESRYSSKWIMCQEPDLNWWHEDFQSSALPTELSRPFPTQHPLILVENWGLCQEKGWKGITKSYLGSGIFGIKTLYGSLRLGIIQIQMSKVLLAQSRSCVIYITRLVIREKLFCSDTFVKEESMRKKPDFDLNR